MTQPEPMHERSLSALLELLERVEGSQDATALVSEEELSGWPTAAVSALKSCKLLVRATPAASVTCPGCEQECTMPVQTVADGVGGSATFVVCDKRDDINRVSVSAARLRLWRGGAEAVGRFVARSLGLREAGLRWNAAGLWELGLVTGRKRSQMVCLRTGARLEVVVGHSAIPLTDLVRSGADGYSVDSEAIRQMADAATGDSRHTPSNMRREARKLKTQALHARWQREYRELKKRRPGMSDVWYSQQIARLDIAMEKSAETIRKQMTR